MKVNKYIRTIKPGLLRELRAIMISFNYENYHHLVKTPKATNIFICLLLFLLILIYLYFIFN